MSIVPESESALAAHFWQVSCAFYANKVVQQKLLEGQDNLGWSINRILFACWSASYLDASGSSIIRATNSGELDRIETRLSELRLLRRQLREKSALAFSRRHRSMAGELALKLELEGEKLHQRLLVIYLLADGVRLKVRKFSGDSVVLKQNLLIHCQCLGVSASPPLVELADDWIEFIKQIGSACKKAGRKQR